VEEVEEEEEEEEAAAEQAQLPSYQASSPDICPLIPRTQCSQSRGLLELARSALERAQLKVPKKSLTNTSKKSLTNRKKTRPLNLSDMSVTC